GIDEVALEIDHHQRGRRGIEVEAVGFCLDGRHDQPPCQSRPMGVGIRSGTIRVPVWPAIARSRAAGVVIRTSLPPWARKSTAASIFGPMLPLGNSPSARYWLASAAVIEERRRWSGWRKCHATCSTPVDRTRSGTPRLAARRAEARSLSITASTPS